MPSRIMLTTTKFQGKQVYGTICDNCRYRSERVTDFLEVEINFKVNPQINLPAVHI